MKKRRKEFNTADIDKSTYCHEASFAWEQREICQTGSKQERPAQIDA